MMRSLFFERVGLNLYSGSCFCDVEQMWIEKQSLKILAFTLTKSIRNNWGFPVKLDTRVVFCTSVPKLSSYCPPPLGSSV